VENSLKNTSPSQQPDLTGLRFKGSDATLVQSRACLTAPIFTSARACGHQTLAKTRSQGTTHHTDDLVGSLVLSCVLCASLEETLGEDSPLATSRQHQRPRYSLRIIGMLWTGRSCRRRECWLWRKRKCVTGPATAPRLRQNPIKCSKRGLFSIVS
jgi:hypothetical protein